MRHMPGLVLLIAALLAGCGSAAGGSPSTPTPDPTPTSTHTASTTNGAAAARVTATAVQAIAATAVAGLQAKARADSGKTVSTTGSSPVAVAARPAVRSPTALPLRRAAHSRRASVLHIAAAASCCGTGIGGERRSAAFTASGAWQIRWGTRCAHPLGGLRPGITIGIVPEGATQPADVVQPAVPGTGLGRGAHSESLGGMYYLDIVSPCEAWTVAAVTSASSARIAPNLHPARIPAGPNGRSQAQILHNARQQLQAVTSSARAGVAARASATATVESRIRERDVAALTALLKETRLDFRQLKTVARAIDPANTDFNPQGLQTQVATIGAASSDLVAAQRRLNGLTLLSVFGPPAQVLANAIQMLQAAAANLDMAIADLQGGSSTRASNDLGRARTTLHAVNTSLRQTKGLLTTLSSG